MRYSMKARVIPGKAAALRQALDDGSFSREFPYGDLGETVREGVADQTGDVRWIEVCYCREAFNIAMRMELEYFERFFHAIEVGDARDPRYCKGYPVCNDCLCTKTIRFPGVPFDAHLAALIETERTQPPRHIELIPTRWTGWRGRVQTDEEKGLNTQCRLAM
jgi:hypothetical protein